MLITQMPSLLGAMSNGESQSAQSGSFADLNLNGQLVSPDKFTPRALTLVLPFPRARRDTRMLRPQAHRAWVRGWLHATP